MSTEKIKPGKMSDKIKFKIYDLMTKDPEFWSKQTLDESRSTLKKQEDIDVGAYALKRIMNLCGIKPAPRKVYNNNFRFLHNSRNVLENLIDIQRKQTILIRKITDHIGLSAETYPELQKIFDDLSQTTTLMLEQNDPVKTTTNDKTYGD